MLSRICCLLFALVCIVVVSNKGSYKRPVFEQDRAGYYIYLPATFIYGDVTRLSFYDSISQKYNSTGAGPVKLSELPNGNRATKYPIGTAIFNLPFFCSAHIYCLVTDHYPADGFSIPYRIAIIGGAIFWSLLSLFILRKFLKNYFDDRITALVLLCLSFGTNLYYYVAFEPGMSHSYSFLLFAGVLYATEQWVASGKAKYAWSIGLLIGLSIVVRPVNVIIILIPLMWKVADPGALKERLQLVVKASHFLPSLIFFILPLILQMVYWKISTGQFVYYSYTNEGFDWGHPKIWDGLFSYRKGWFVYTPLALVAFIGLIFSEKTIVPGLITFYAIALYVFFSWENWYYGASYGCRPLIETLPLLAIPLGNLSSYLVNSFKKSVKVSYVVTVALLIALNIFQSYQYGGNVIHWDRMTKQYYWRVFLKVRANETDKHTCYRKRSIGLK